jgi:hypothetical protein
MTISDYERLYKERKEKKLFWQIVKGITGMNYKTVKEIPGEDAKDVIAFLAKEGE